MKGDEVKVNGGEVLDPFVISPSYYEMTVKVQAQHDWSEWKVTKEPTASLEGEETRICAGCHKEEKRSIPIKDSEKKNDEKKNDSKNEATNNSANKSATVSKSSSAIPKTGDENQPWLYAALLLASLMVIVSYTNYLARSNSKKIMDN